MSRYIVFFTLLFCYFPLSAQTEDADTYIRKHQGSLYYASDVSRLYPNSQRKWNRAEDRKEIENQFALLILADVNNSLAKRYENLQNTEGLEYDVLATDTLLYMLTYQSLIPKYGTRWLFGGRLNNDFGKPSLFLTEKVNQHFEDDTLTALVSQLKPQSKQYQDLYTRLYRYYDPYHQEAPKLYSSRLLKPNQDIPYKSLVYRLQISGELNEEQTHYFLNQEGDKYNNELVNVVKSFQKRHGLVVDGIVGKRTLYWLNMSTNERVRIMALNIQRLRLWENKNARFVLVNIPSYEMGYWSKGELVFKSKVIVGKPARKTPLFITRLDSIIFNPNWKVPTKIMKEDILPKALENQDYLLTHNYEVLPSWLSDEVIPFESIEWETMTVDNFPYKLRQKSGNANALGRYKFNTPNRNAIYLHDTPSRSLFNKQHRAYSSGCIRVEKASEFAQLLMKESHFTAKDYAGYHRLPKTNTVGLSQKIAVYTIYQTAWVDEADTIQFRNDVYRYDEWSKSKN